MSQLPERLMNEIAEARASIARSYLRLWSVFWASLVWFWDAAVDAVPVDVRGAPVTDAEVG
jgi:hypothetical protein